MDVDRADPAGKVARRKRRWGVRRMAAGRSSVGEVRVKPDRLHAFAMAICRADGSSAEEAKLVADHLVLANLFGHDSHGVA